jgi:hypothetical protein
MLDQEPDKVPFYKYHDWVRSRLVNKVVVEERGNLEEGRRPSAYQAFWNVFWGEII